MHSNTDSLVTSSTSTSSKLWWEEVRSDPAKMQGWLLDQYRGEVTAAIRIALLRDRFPTSAATSKLLTVIARQEAEHARWVASLLRARGIAVVVADKAERYWDAQALASIADLQTGCAVGAHAERMRLERIEVIAGDLHAPPDVRAVFARILPEERFHERAFRERAGAAALEATRAGHEVGRAALGLAP